MRKIEIPFKHFLEQNEAEKFLNQWHRHTSKIRPHILTFTFNTDNIWIEEINYINWYIDLLYQAYIIKNNVEKIFINTDKRNRNYLTINVW